MPRKTRKNNWYTPEEAKAQLLPLLPAGATVYTILKHVSRSGMYRAIDCYIIQDNEPRRITGLVSAALDWRYDDRHEGVAVNGCGMDMGFHLIYALSSALYGWGNEGGYLVKQRWL